MSMYILPTVRVLILLIALFRHGEIAMSPGIVGLIDSTIQERTPESPVLTVEKKSIRNVNMTSQWSSISHVTVSSGAVSSEFIGITSPALDIWACLSS